MNCQSCGQAVVETLKFEDLEVNVRLHKVTRAGQQIKLTPREFSALVCLMQQPGRPLTRTDICKEAWKVGFEGLTNCVDVYMNYLRKKIDAGRSPLIHTVRGIGYTLAREDATA